MSGLKYWIWLSTRRGLRPRAALKVLEWFGTPEAAFFADKREYDLIPDLTPQARKGLYDRSTGQVNAILGECERLGIRLMTYQDAAYPERLRNIWDPPLVLYVKGRSIPFDEKVVIGVVGTRKCTSYGVKMAGNITMELARSGAVVVSGIAEGCDAAGIRGALMGGGTVVSVLGGGIDVRYPACNRFLYDDVAAAGALISEYPPGTPAYGNHFPIRNRIISGLSQGVVVIESGIYGGSMRTVQHVEEQNRDLFAVPGPVDAPASAGTNLLIGEGSAKLVRNAWDILEEYADRYPHAIRRPEPLPQDVTDSRLELISRAVSAVQPGEEKPSPAPGPELTLVPKQPREEPAKPKPDDGRIPWSQLSDRLTDDQRDILLALEEKPRIADDLVELTQIPARRVLSALTILEMQDFVVQEPGKRFRAKVKLKME